MTNTVFRSGFYLRTVDLQPDPDEALKPAFEVSLVRRSRGERAVTREAESDVVRVQQGGRFVTRRLFRHAHPASSSSSDLPLSADPCYSATTSEPTSACSSRLLISSHWGFSPGRVRCRAKPPRSFSPLSTKTAWPRSSASGQGTRPPCS